MNLAGKCRDAEGWKCQNDARNQFSVYGGEIPSILSRIELELLRSMNVRCQDFTKNAAEHKFALERLRERVKEKICQVEAVVDFDQSTDQTKERFAAVMTDINNSICDSVKNIVQKIITECRDVLGEPPCQFAAVCLGSFAFGTTTPYSDVEWAFLLDVEDERFKEYFRHLARLFHFKIVCLGETIVPSVMIESLNSEHNSWFYDDVTPRGLAVDGAMAKACKTPLGRRDESGNIVFELIHSPEKMAEFQNLKWLNTSFELSTSLRSFQVVYSSEPIKGAEIIQRYGQELLNQLERRSDGDSLLLRDEVPCDSHSCLPKEMQWKEGSKGFGFHGDNARPHGVRMDDIVESYDETKVSETFGFEEPMNNIPQKDKERFNKQKIFESAVETSSKAAADENMETEDKTSLIGIPVKDAEKLGAVAFETRVPVNSRTGKQNIDSQSCSSLLKHDISDKQEKLPDEDVQSDGGRLSTMRDQHVKILMANDMPTYHLHDVLCTSDTEGMIYNVKKDLYRQPERALSILFLKFGIKNSNVYEGLEELRSKGLISDQVKRNLVMVLCIACELRLKTYLEHGRQLEELDIPSSISACCSGFSTLIKAKETYSVKAKLDRLVHFYRIVLPFLEKLREDCAVSSDCSGFVKWKFREFDQSSYYSALIYLRLLRYEDARYFSLKAIHENPEHPHNWQVLARLLEKQGKHEQAFYCLMKSFRIFFAGNDDILSLCLETKHEGLQEDTATEEIPADAWVKRIQEVLHDSRQIKFIASCLQRMALDAFFACRYQKAWRYFRIVYWLVRNNPRMRRKDAVSTVFSSVALCLSAAGRYKEAIDDLEFILKNNLVSPIQIPKARDNLGNAYFGLGNYKKALEEYRKALKLRCSYYRVDGSPFLVISYVNIGNVLGKIGRVVESDKYFYQALEVIRRIYHNPCGNFAEHCYSGIGKNLLSIGRNAEALEYCKKGAEIARNRLGHRIHKSYAMALVGLGNCYLYLLRFKDAVKAYEESIDIFQKIKVNEDADVLPVEIAVVYCNLAVALHQQGQSQTALRCLHEAESKMAAYVSKESHPNMGVVFHTKAQIIRAQGKHKEAKELLESALEIFLKVFGTEFPHSLIINTLTHLGNLSIALRQYETAVNCFHRALRLLDSSTVPEGAYVQLKINVNKNMGYALYQLKQIPDALLWYKAALEMRRKHAEASPLDVDPRSVLSLNVEAGNAYIRIGDQREAMRLYEAAINMPISLSCGVCELKKVALSLAAMQTRAGQLNKAVQSFQKAASLHVESGMDKNDPFVVKCYQNQGALYRTIGDQEKACVFSEKALAVQLLATNSAPNESTAKLLAQVAEAWSYSNIQKAIEFGMRSLEMIATIGSLEGLEHNVRFDLGFYYHLHALKHEDENEQHRLYQEAENNYNRALELKMNVATLFNRAFLLIATSRFCEACKILKHVSEICGKESMLGFDDRDAPLLNQKVWEKLFSRHKSRKVTVRTVVLAYYLIVQCYFRLADELNALSEASKLEKFVCDLENPDSTDYQLTACAFEELSNPTKANFYLQKCS